MLFTWNTHRIRISNVEVRYFTGFSDVIGIVGALQKICAGCVRLSEKSAFSDRPAFAVLI